MSTENTGYPAVEYEPGLRWKTRLASQRPYINFVKKSKYRTRQKEMTDNLNRCKDAPFVINSGRSGYGDLANWGNPEKEQIISEMLRLARHGYLTYTSEPTGMSRTYSSKDYTFTLTEKGKQFLGISKQPASDEDVQTAGMRGGFVAEEAERQENLTVADKARIEAELNETLFNKEMLDARDEAHLAGEEVSRNPEKGATPQCPVCYHNHEKQQPHLD